MAGIDFDQRKDFQFFESDYRLPSRSFHRDGHTRTEPVKQEKLPHIVVKDVTGRRLDTFTHLQEAIYRARQNIKQTKQALTSDEWRLPHAPPPARPDYSRAAPPLAKFRDRLKGDINQLSRTTKTTATKIFEVDVDDVAFVQQSIRNLPNIPSLSFLRQEILAEPKNYFQIVNTILLHKRFMKQTDKRDAIYNFPGFCTGCRRAGLCYGCEQSSMPHYHADKMMKTGGGFTYYKKYKPEHQIPGRHPLNWKIQFPELALKSVMEDHDKEDLGLLGEDIEHDENCLLKAMLENNVSLPQINKDSLRTTGSSTSRESEEKNEDEGIVADGRSLDDKLSKKDHRSARMSGTSGQGSDQSGEGSYGYDNSQNGYVQVVPHPRIVDLRQQENDEDQLSFDENFIKESMDRASNGTRENEEQCRNEDTEGEGMDTDNGEEYDANQEMYSEDEDKNGDNDSRSRSRTRSNKSSDKHGRQILTGSTRNKDDYKDGDGSVVTKSSSPSSRKYNRLYQAPPAFKIKKSERRKVKTSSPFSSNRDYNLNLNKKFELKKSDRKGTEFREFQQHRGDWKAPPKFELKDNQREDMKFWKAPQKKDQGNKKRSRSRKTEHVSPDSGLDSEKLAEMQRQGSGMTRVSLFTPSSGSGSNKNNRPNTRDSGLESRPMTRERMPMFQRKPIIHENDNTQERQYDDIKSQMETATESISPSESWISKVRAANNPDDTFDLDPRRQPHSDNKDEEKSTRRNREKNQNEARYIRPENMNFRKDIDDNGQDMRQSHGSHEKQSHGSQEKQSHVVQSMSGAISPIIYETTAHPWINSGDSDREYEKANHDHYGNRKSRKQINVQLPDASMEEELVESSDVSQTSESDLELDFDDVIIEGDKGPSNMQSDKDQRNHRIERRDEDEKIDDIADEKLKDSFKMKQKMINEKLNDVSERQNGRRRRGREEDINELDEMRDENYTSSADRKERRRCRRRHMNGENLMDADIERKEYKDGSQDRKVRRHRRRRKNIDNEENDASPEFMARQAHRKGRNESKDEESLKDENGDASMERKVRRKHRIRKNDKEIRGNFNAEYDDEQKARRRRRRITVDDEEIGEGTSDNVEVGKRKDQRHSRHQRERQRRDEMAEDNDVEDEIKSRISELNDNKMKERLALYGNSDNESRRLNTSVERALLAYMNSDSETEAEDQLYEDENQIKDEDEEGNQIDEKRNFTVDDGQEALMANNFIKNISDVDASKERKNRKALKNNMDLDVLKHTNDLDDISTHDTFEKFGSMDENKDVNNKDYKWTEIKMEDEESMKPRTQLQGRKHDKFKRTKRNQKNKGNDNNADVLDKVAVSYNTDQGDKNVKDADENLADDTEESDTEILKIESYNYPNLREKDEKELYKKHERKKKSKIASKQNERKVTKKKKAKENNEEVDFNNLPSIHDTLSKLLPKNKLILLEGLKSIDEEIKGNNHHEKNNDKQLGSENNHRIFSIKSESLDRPRSASPEHLGVAFPSMLRRTSSLPSIADFVNQKIPDLEYQEFDFPQKQTTKTCPTCGDPTPEVNHVCLPKFKNRFRPKKTKDPNKKVRHGGIGVRQRKNNNTDDSDTISEMTVTTVNTQSEVQAGSQFQHVSRWPSSQAVLKGSKDTNKEPAKEMDGAERVLTPASQKISTPPDSPQLAMTPQPFRFPTPEFTVGKSGPSRPIRTPSPVVEKPKRVIQKKQFVKKEIERKPPTPIARSCTPQTPLPQVKEQETAIVTPEPEDTTPIKLPELVRLDTPPLPEITEQKRERAAKDDRRTAILPVPKLKEALKSPTQRKKKVNMPRSTHKRSRSKQAAEAPVTKEEVREMRDPLDFLAKYCIVSKDRLPFYERIYKNIIEGQPMRYDREPILSPRTGMPIDKNDGNSHGMGWDKHQLNMFHDIVTISRGRDVARPGVGVSEQYLEKISYTLEMLDKKQRQITDDLHVLQSKKLGQIAERAKQLIPEIARVQYQPKVKKSKKKKKKKKGKNLDEFGDDEDEPPSVPLRAEDITDEVIAMRLDESMYKKICKTGEIPQIDLEMQRCAEKLTGIDDRLMVLEGDKNLLSLYCMEVFFNEQNDNNQPIEFRRQQSALFRHLHPDPDIEMNIEELEGALQVVNHNLISESEFDYIYQILNLPGRRKINFQLFTVIAALSEKISQMDPVIKKILIKDNPEETKKKRRSYDALDLKMETSKELFGLLADGDYETNNNGNAKASQLAVELTAGGLDPECVGYVLSKFNRFGTGYIDFMDFVTYVPLFIEIHQKIVDDPFNVSLDIS
ncbi:uncharacterized protein LOC134690130 [Mytilus trossulus]|uniref:uncharacterized protein LOC134690130 n=1 Tax=Mytilus trossulus TaxID=6551 RepID=UPI003005D4DD